jgi:hypothetical protein
MRACVSLIAVLAAAVAPLGCIASKRPEPLTDAEIVRLERARFPALVVGVVDPEPGLGSASGRNALVRREQEGLGDVAADREVQRAIDLIEDLRATGYFREVDFWRQLKSPADLLATPGLENGRKGEIAGGGVFTLASLGVVPTWLTNEWRRNFSLTSSDGEDYAAIDVRYSQVIVLSWTAIPLLPFRDWTLGWNVVPEDYDDAFRLTLLEHRAEIERLAAKRAPP